MTAAEIVYTVDTGEKLVNETFGPNNIRRRTSGSERVHPVEIRDGRPARKEFSLDENGFVLVDHPSAVKDFFDPRQLESVYYPEVERLVKELSGAKRAVVFDHTLRSGDEAEREAKLVREPVLSAHNDYTEWSGPQRVREIMGDESNALLERRFTIKLVTRAQMAGQYFNNAHINERTREDAAAVDLVAQRTPHRGSCSSHT